MESKGKIAAIGVLGSDVYDKLLLLQALRPKFPEAVFFTTDLDELLLPQEKLRYTRNLLVASGFGLTLAPDLQRDVLPFRSTYQTSVFLATQLAVTIDTLAYPETGKSNGAKIDPNVDPKTDAKWAATAVALDCWTKQPQLFQIGRTEPRSLPIDPMSDKDEACNTQGKHPAAGLVDYLTIQPPIPPLYPSFTLKALRVTFGLPIVLLGILFCLPPVGKVLRYRLAPSEATAQSEEPEHASAADLHWLIPLLVLILTTMTIWALLTLDWPTTAKWLTGPDILGTPIATPGGEPMTLFEGISIWPTIAAPSFGIILSLFLIWYTLRILEINVRETADEMGIPPQPEDAAAGSILARFWLPRKTSSEKLKLYVDDADRPIVDFSAIFSPFSFKPEVRCLRALALTVGLMLIGTALFLMSSSVASVPVRGARARDLYIWISLADVIVTLFLTMLVTDATLHSRSFIVRLTGISAQWPDATRMRFAQCFDVQGTALADWLDMKFMSLRTSCITQLIYLPFLSLSVLLLPLSQLFDDFSLPWPFLAFYGFIIGIVVAAVLAYRSAADNARKKAQEHLRAKIIAAQPVRTTARQLERMLSEIENLKEGAFAPLTSQPVVKAVLLPLVTYGGGWLAHIYSLPGT